MNEQDRLAQDEAAQVLRRAAWLQAEASRHEEAEAAGTAEIEGLKPGSAEGYEIGTVRSAAIEAGIDARFVDAALVDVRAERSLPVVPKNRELARRFFGTLLEAVTVRRVIQAAASDVLSTIMTVVPGEPYRLTLSDRIGDPLGDGALVFDIQGTGNLKKPWLADEVSMSAVRQVYVSIRDLQEPERACEVTLRGPIAYSHNTGLVHGLIVTGLGGGVGGLALAGATLAALGGVLAAPLGIAAAGVAAGAGLAAGGVLGRNGYRAYCRRGIDRAARALHKVLTAVAIQAEHGRAGHPASGRPGVL